MANRYILVAVALVGFAANAHAFLENFYSFQQPTQIINSFRDTIFVSTLRLKREAAATQQLLDHLNAMIKFQEETDKEIESMTSSITSLILDLPGLYGRSKDKVAKFVENVKELTALRNKMDENEVSTFKAFDEVFDRLREILTSLGATELPGEAFELIGDNRVKQEFNFAQRVRQEKALFDKAMELYTADKFEEAHPLFWQAWEAYNTTLKFGSRVTIQELTLLDHVQYTAFKVGNFHRAADVAAIIANSETWTDDVRNRHAENVKVYLEQIRLAEEKKSEETKSEETAKTEL